MSQIDLLLLNASNLPQRPIYPYAFVQVSAIARRFGLDVRRLDLLQVRRELWQPMLRDLMLRHRPRMVGIHLRQGDSIAQSDYYDPLKDVSCGSYFPVQDTLALVRLLRELGNMPVVIGGIGFTTHARKLFEFLEVDYGVQGDPDGFFARFEDVVAGRDLDTVPSLIYRKDGTFHANTRGYYPPAGEREYTDAIVSELVGFYGHAQLYGPNPPTVAVEIMRGCPFRCYFCSEPYVKGRRIDYRNVDTIVGELEFLLSHNIRRFWFVCSELNIQGTDFAMTLAEQVIRLGQAYPGSPIEWSGYSLPRMSEEELRVLQRAGYVGALNDVLSLDDENLRRAGVPYRSHQAITFLKSMSKLAEEERQAQVESNYEVDDKLRERLATRTPKELGNLFSLFLGNAHADERTIRNTLQQVEEHGLREHYRAGHVIASTRVFELDGQYICGSGEEASRIISYDAQGTRPLDLLWPSFYYPRFLMRWLGTPPEVHKFFAFVGETFLSVAHRTRKDWNWFLARNSRSERLCELLAGSAAAPLGAREADPLVVEKATLVLRDPQPHAVLSLIAPEPAQKQLWNQVAGVLLEHIFRVHPEPVAAVAKYLGIPIGERGEVMFSEYRLMERLYRDYDSVEQLIDDVGTHLDVPRDSLQVLYLQWLLYVNNVTIRPEYRELLFEPSARQSAADTRVATH